jgi:hypothetical protein
VQTNFLKIGTKRKKDSNSKMTQNTKASKQQTLDRKYDRTDNDAKKEVIQQKTEKQIVITEISTTTKVDELSLKVDFRLVPSRTAFSKVHFVLWFDNQQIRSVSIRIPQGSLAADEFELTPVLDMKGIPAGSYTIKVEMYEFWSSGEKLSEASKGLNVDYVPQTRESRFVKVPTVKSVAGKDLAVVSEPEKIVFREIEKTIKKEQLSKRDDW